MKEFIKTFLSDKSIALLGFGREGRSTYKLIRGVFPQKPIAIIDDNANVRLDAELISDQNLIFITGEGCMASINNFEIAIKSPGIPSNSLPEISSSVQLTSQTDIFLQYFGQQVIGVTGTKGKSTTSSLIYHILKSAGKNVLLVGNIGIPPFDCIGEIKPDTTIVMELSSHQLEFVAHAPHIAVLLNIFQEHLDHYNSYRDYQLAKLNIGKCQGKNDYFIYNNDNEALANLLVEFLPFETQMLPFSILTNSATAVRLDEDIVLLDLDDKILKLYDTSSGQPLKGQHNLYNILAAAMSCFLRGASSGEIGDGIRSFKGLEHRIELVGEYAGIVWYNDSIATIPEATIEAVKTLKIVDTLILGGFDRGIDYKILYPFLIVSGIRNIIFVGEAGMRIKEEFAVFGQKQLNFFEATDFIEVVQLASEITQKGKICLLSPAAASYDMFKNFEHRGNTFKNLVYLLQ
ncbi:MAG: UDP-N-acetylmuramoyl-L-alanine--D-glutamate ligase [Bacteroidales bacterium]